MESTAVSRFIPLKKCLLSNQQSEKSKLFAEFDNCGAVSGIGNVKWETPIQNPAKSHFYSLWVADMDYPVPNFIQKALRDRISIPNYGYTETTEEYYKSIIQWYHNNHGFQLKKSDIYRCSAKVVSILGLLLQTFTEIGDGIMLLTPIYHAFFAVISANERKILESPLIFKDNSFFIDYEDLEDRILKDKPKIMLFCNPHNPVGRVWRKDEIERVQEICLRYGVLMVSDEVFSDFTFNGTKHVVAAFEPYDQNTVVMMSLGKAFNLNGVETGFFFSKNPKLIEKINKNAEKVELVTVFGNVFSELVTKAAYSAEGRVWLEYVKEYIYGNYLMMVEYFSQNLKKIVPVNLEGSFILVCDYERLGVSEEEFMKKTLEENIFVVEGSKFHAKRKMFRINIACSRKLLRGALEKLVEIFKGK